MLAVTNSYVLPAVTVILKGSGELPGDRYSQSFTVLQWRRGGGGRNSIESDMELPWKDDGVQNFECSEVETRANSRKACDQSPGSPEEASGRT